MKNIFQFKIANCKLLIAFCLLLISSCTSKKENKETKQVKEENPTEIELSKEQFEAAGIQFGTIEQKNLKNVIKATGYLSVPPQNKASVSSYMGAVVKNIFVQQGNSVKKGQLLGTLEHPDFITLQENYFTEKNNLSFLEKEYIRQKELYEQNAGTGKVFQKTESDYNASKARLNSMESKLNMFGVSTSQLDKGKTIPFISLNSPIDGYVGNITINIGSYAAPNIILFDIVDNSKIYCDLSIYEKDIFKVKIGQRVNFTLANLPAQQQDNLNKIIKGEIFGVNKSFEKDSKALIIHANIDNPNHELIPGIYVNALIEIGEQKANALPSEAIVKSGDKEYVFIFTDMKKSAPKKVSEEEKEKQEENKSIKTDSEQLLYEFKIIEVITGVSELGYTEIKPVVQISPDSKIVVKGAFFLLSKMKGGGEEEKE